MKFNCSIGDHPLGERTIPITVSCDMKTRHINFNTVFYVVEIDLLEGKCRMRSWIIRSLVSTFHSMRISFLNFFQHFVRNVFLTDDVLLSIGAPELIEFKNKIDQLDYHQDLEAALDRLREEMLTLGISIIQHNDLFVGANCNDEYHLSSFQFKEEDAEFVSSEELARELGDNYTPRCSQLRYETDRQEAKQRILKLLSELSIIMVNIFS